MHPVKNKVKVLRILNRFNIGGPILNVTYLTKYINPDKYHTLLIGGQCEKHEQSAHFILDEEGVRFKELKYMRRAISPFFDLIALFQIILIVYLILILDTKVQSKLDVDALANGISVIAEVPQIKFGSNSIFSNPNDRSVLAESFRILTTNMNFVLPPEKGGKAIFCTSTIKGEGKTFISLNFSLALASLNNKVLLIGGDLRNPQLHSYAEFDKNQVGLSNYLNDPLIDWKSLPMQVFEKQPNHEVLFSGTIPPNPAHLLANGNFETLIKEAKLIYDFVIVDLAPIILVTDTLLIAHQADATICVVRSNHTDKKLIPFSVNLSKTERLKNMSYVINGISENKSYGYSYNYGYNYGYGEPES